MRILGARLSILCVLLMLLAAVSLFASAPSADSFTAFDKYGNLCWEDEKARLDNFAIQLQRNSSKPRGFIIVAAGRSSCTNEANYRAKRAKDYLVKLGVSSDRVVIRDVGFEDEVATELWVVPTGSPFPEAKGNLKNTEVSIHKCVGKVFASVLCPNQK